MLRVKEAVSTLKVLDIKVVSSEFESKVVATINKRMEFDDEETLKEFNELVEDFSKELEKILIK